MTTDPNPESARALLDRHGLPEDVVDGVLCLHAQELAAVQRKEAAVWGVDTAAGKRILEAADLIDPTRTAAAVPVAAPPTTEQGALRDRVRRAVCEAEGFGWDTDMLEPDEYGEVADAVLAVLPEPNEVDRLRTENARMRHELEVMYGGAFDSQKPTPADRAATLREAATRYEEILANANTGQDPRYWTAVRDVTLGLRAMADEERPEGDDTVHACPGRWGGPACTCFDSNEAEQAVAPRVAAEAPPTETRHVCQPGASTYHCPTSGQTESDCHGGFSTCCDRPDLHDTPAVVAQPGKETTAALLSSECDACRHTLNWHRNDIGCTVDRCVCGRFQPPTGEQPQ